MARYDDGKRGFGVADALGLSEAWQQAEARQSAGTHEFPVAEAPPGMLEALRVFVPSDQLERVVQSQLRTEAVERAMLEAIRTAQLPLWIAPIEGAHEERLVAANALFEFRRESLIAGCYRPFNDVTNPVYGYPLFVKRADWERFMLRFDMRNQPVQADTSTAGAESQCREWLERAFADDPDRRRNKGSFREAALAEFAGRLSARGFNDRVWPALAQRHGRDGAGAKPKS